MNNETIESERDELSLNDIDRIIHWFNCGGKIKDIADDYDINFLTVVELIEDYG